MAFALRIAYRYFRTKSSRSAINIINIVALTVVVVASSAMFIVLSAFTGLKQFGLSFSNILQSDLLVTPKSGKYFVLNELEISDIRTLDGVQAASPTVSTMAMFRYGQKSIIAELKGVDHTYSQVIDTSKLIYLGKWIDGIDQAILGFSIGHELGVSIFSSLDRLEVVIPSPGSQDLLTRQKPLRDIYLSPVGIYSLTSDLDSKYVFCPIDQSRDLLNLDSTRFSGLEIKLRSGANEGDLRSEIQRILGDVDIRNRAQQNISVYRMLRTENLAIYFIFTLILVIAFFNISSYLSMVILDKKNNLKTLFFLGSTISSLRKIFLWLGLMISSFGGFLGVVLGVVLVGLQEQFSLFMITAHLPYPVALTGENLALVGLTLLILGLLSSFLSSKRVGKKLLDSY